MRGWRVFVKGATTAVQGRLLDISDRHLVVMGDTVLPYSMKCDLRLTIPPRANNPHATHSLMAGEVQEVVFAEGGIRLVFKVDAIPSELERLVDEFGMRKPRSVYMTV